MCSAKQEYGCTNFRGGACHNATTEVSLYDFTETSECHTWRDVSYYHRVPSECYYLDYDGSFLKRRNSCEAAKPSTIPRCTEASWSGLLGLRIHRPFLTNRSRALPRRSAPEYLLHSNLLRLLPFTKHCSVVKVSSSRLHAARKQWYAAPQFY